MAGSLFALAQSIAMGAGIPLIISVVGGAVGGAVGAALAAIGSVFSFM